MNLKEAFRYQRFLENTMDELVSLVASRSVHMKSTERHLKNRANPEAENEIIDGSLGQRYDCDALIALMGVLVEERQGLMDAIGNAKYSIGWDLDAAIGANKFRQVYSSTLRRILNSSSGKNITHGTDYKFNIEGNQIAYIYDIETEETEAFDRESARLIMKNANKKADEVSANIDAAMTNTTVDYNPPFDVNDGIDEVIEEFLAMPH